MTYCPRCKGIGLVDGPPIEYTWPATGKVTRYPVVMPCPECKAPSTAVHHDEKLRRPDHAERAAGERADD